MKRFTRMLAQFGWVIAVSSALGVVHANDDAALMRIADEHIVPGYAELAARSENLADVLNGYCAAPNADALNQARMAYAQSYRAWQAMQHVRFGPVQWLNREYRFQLWPDKRGSVRRHLDTLLASADADELNPERFAAGSVAVQGYSALERLLWDDVDALQSGSRACAVVHAIGVNLRDMTQNLHADWVRPDGHRVLFVSATQGNATYASRDELMGKLLNSLVTQLQWMQETKLGRPLGEGKKRVRPQQAEAWRSGETLHALAANMRGASALYQVAFAPQLNPQSPLAAEIATDFAEAQRILNDLGLEHDIAALLNDAVHVQQLEALQSHIARLRERIGGEMATTLGLALGFNSLDGD